MKELKFKVGDLILWCGEKDKVATIISITEDNEFYVPNFEYLPVYQGNPIFTRATFYSTSEAYTESIVITSKLARLFYV